jgi:hypothetical protein
MGSLQIPYLGVAIQKGGAMGATIQPDYFDLIKKVEVVPTRCTACGTQKWVSEQDWYGQQGRNWYCQCGDLLESPDFYPTEFQKVEAHWTYSSLEEMFDLMGLGSQFDYCGSISTEVVKQKLNRLAGSRFHETMTQMVELAEKLQVNITWG